MSKSDDCVNSEHGLCAGIIKETDGLTRICDCPCHESTYQLVRNTLAATNLSQKNNSFQFTDNSDI